MNAKALTLSRYIPKLVNCIQKQDMNRKTHWRIEDSDPTAVEQLQKQLNNLHPALCALLLQRGVSNYEQAEQFFRPKLSQLHSPFLMKDMSKAVRRLEKAIIRKEKILIYGDYDVDGTTSVALMMSFLSRYHDEVDFYIPDRYKEGYGVSNQGIDFAINEGIGLIISLDCGITAVAQVAAAKAAGIDFIICDHHLPPSGELPEALAILNPKQLDCGYPFKELSGCAVGFKLLQAFAEQNEIDAAQVFDLLDFVAVSLACDFVPLRGENRILAHFGLQRFNENPSTGFAALKLLLQRDAEAVEYGVHELVFRIGPVINAAGRIDHAKEAVRLMLSREKTTASLHAQSLIDKNQARRNLEAEIVAEAIESIETQCPNLEQQKTIILYRPNWHKGVIGIVASKIVELHYRPTIILTLSEGKLVGSVRSVADFDVHAALTACAEHLISYGGHHQAAGLSLTAENLPAFRAAFEAEGQKHFGQREIIENVAVAAELNLIDVNDRFWRVLKQFAPFGTGNMRPVFYAKLVKDTGNSRILKDKHLKFVVRQGESEIVEGIGFNMAEYYEQVHSRTPFHAYYVIDENHYQDKKTLQLQMRHVKF